MRGKCDGGDINQRNYTKSISEGEEESD